MAGTGPAPPRRPFASRAARSAARRSEHGRIRPHESSSDALSAAGDRGAPHSVLVGRSLRGYGGRAANEHYDPAPRGSAAIPRWVNSHITAPRLRGLLGSGMQRWERRAPGGPPPSSLRLCPANQTHALDECGGLQPSRRIVAAAVEDIHPGSPSVAVHPAAPGPVPMSFEFRPSRPARLRRARRRATRQSNTRFYKGGARRPAKGLGLLTVTTWRRRLGEQIQPGNHTVHPMKVMGGARVHRLR
jgi:hypothetical protein